MSSSPLPLLLLVLAHLGGSASVARAAFAPLAARNGPSFNARQTSGAALRVMSSSSSCGEMTLTDDDDDTNPSSAPSVSDTSSSRRAFFDSIFGAASVSIALSQSNPRAALAAAAAVPASSKPTSEAKVTDKIYIDLKGIPAPVVEGSSSDDATAATAASPATSRIVIGLFGEDAPQPVSILKQLVSKAGLPAECKPKETRTLQREQLEASKVYNACVDSQERGVTYDLSNVWRIDRDVRIDVGSVSGKFVSRVSPNFEDSAGGGGSGSGLIHDAPGIVSVRRGDDGGFGFAIYPGGGDASVLNEDNIVVGKILEGMDVVARLNDVPVVQSSAVNYMALTGGAKGKTAPSRACRYGGPMYCNELKPLKKIQISSTGVL